MPDPSWSEHLRARLASLSLSPAREAEIIDELSQHLDERYEELRAGGASDPEARRLVIEELLDRDALAEQMRSLRQAHVPAPITPGAPTRFLLDGIWQDLRYTARTLRKQPGFAAAAIVTLALGIGATTSIFTVVNSVLINPLPYPNSDALVRIVHSIGGIEQPYFSDAFYASYADNTQAFQDVGVWVPESTATVTGRGDPEEVRTLPATAERADDAWRAARNRALVFAGRGCAGSAEHGDARLRLLAAHVRRRPRRSRSRAHRQRAAAPDYRRHAGGVPVRRRARSHPAAADRPRTHDRRLPAARASPG